MKKIKFIFLMMVILMLPLSASAVERYRSVYLGSQLTVPASASGVAITGSCLFLGITVKTDGTNDVTLNVYNNTTASDPKISLPDAVILGTKRTWSLAYDPGVYCGSGVYVEATSAGTFSYQVNYIQ